MAVDRGLSNRVGRLRGDLARRGHGNYAHWAWAWFVLGAMIAWTIVSAIGRARLTSRSWRLLAADLLVTAVAVLSTALVQSSHAIVPRAPHQD